MKGIKCPLCGKAELEVCTDAVHRATLKRLNEKERQWKAARCFNPGITAEHIREVVTVAGHYYLQDNWWIECVECGANTGGNPMTQDDHRLHEFCKNEGVYDVL